MHLFLLAVGAYLVVYLAKNLTSVFDFIKNRHPIPGPKNG